MDYTVQYCMDVNNTQIMCTSTIIQYSNNPDQIKT